MPHSTTKLRPLGPVYVMPFEAGQAMLDGEDVALVEVEETVELETWLEVPDEADEELDCDEDAVAETVAEDTVEEVPPTRSLAPQTYEAVPAGPKVLLR